MIKKILIWAVLAMIIFTAGCQTVAGLGGDIKWTADRTAELLSPQY